MKEFKYSSSMKPLLSLPSYPGQGAVYSLIVKYDGAVSAYVPIATYSCDLYDDIQSSCRYSSKCSFSLICRYVDFSWSSLDDYAFYSILSDLASFEMYFVQICFFYNLMKTKCCPRVFQFCYHSLCLWIWSWVLL